MVIKELISQDIPVRALVRSRDKARQFQSFPKVEIMEGDLLHPESLSAALDSVERVLLISSSNERMVETQCSFIDACKHAGVPHLIKFSGEESQIGFDPKLFRFTREHEEIEDHLENSGLQWTFLRPSQFMQVYLREAGAIKTKGALFLPLEDIKMSPVDVQDIAKIAVSLLYRGGHLSERLRITGPQALSMAEIASIIGTVTGRPVRYVNIPFEERRQALLAAGLPPFLVDAIEDQSAERRRHPQARVDLSTHQLFDVTPTTFEQFVLRHAVEFGK
jgi:uncharacterized protein YbjT (DUF2867 family)